MAPFRVLVTRPEPGASRTAEKLAAEGFESVIMPLSAIEPTRASLPGTPEAFDALVLTSANAVRHADRSLLEKLSSLPLFAVGQQSADFAASKGLSAGQWPQSGEAEGLVALVREKLRPRSRLLYLAGHPRRAEVEDGLRASGFDVTLLETYRSRPIERDAGQIAALVGERPIDAALVYSAEGGRLLAGLIELHGHLLGLEQAAFIAISPRAAATLGKVARLGVEVADRPCEGAMLAVLEALRRRAT